MRHRKKRLQLNRFTSWRRATLASLARSIFLSESIKTTKIKAKAARSLVEKLISLAKKNSLAAKRQAYKILNDHKIVSILFNEIGPRFANRASGFTRIMGLGLRRGDNAEMVILELTEIKKKEIRKPKKEKEARPKEETAAPSGEIKERPGEERPVSQKPPAKEKPKKKFFGGIKNIFKKERDSL